MRYYVTSDPHAFLTPMLQALNEAGYKGEPDQKIVVLGDVMDRGKEPLEMQKFLLDHLERDDIILVKGNHEDLFVELATIDGGKAEEHHVHNGTFRTGYQLTGWHHQTARARPYDFAMALQQTPFYREIIPAMSDYWEAGDYIGVHGWLPIRRPYSFCRIDPNWRDAGKDTWYRARWDNGMYCFLFDRVPEKTVLCGHYHTSFAHSRYEHNGPEFGRGADFSPYYGKGIIALDACTALSKKVNCVMVEA